MKLKLFLIAMASSFIVFSTVMAESTKDIETAIKTKITVTSRNVFGQVKQPGTVLAIQKEGLRADPPTALLRSSVIKKGVLVEVGGGQIMGGNTGLTMKVGQRVHVYSIRVGKDNITFIYATVDTYNIVEKGNTKSVPYEGAISFKYDDGIEKLTSDQILKDIYKWMKPEAEGGTQTISLGMTQEQVIEILGQPDKKVVLGSKVVFMYKDMKVIFVNGKVTDVQ